MASAKYNLILLFSELVISSTNTLIASTACNKKISLFIPVHLVLPFGLPDFPFINEVEWGMNGGIRHIYEEALKLGLPEPVIQELGTRIRFSVFLDISPNQSDYSIYSLLKLFNSTEMSATELRKGLNIKHKPNFKKSIYTLP